jgi:hypothetical protein
VISLVGLNKADVLAALYNASKPQGMGFMHYDPKPMTRQEAEALLEQGNYFDYLKGRVMKVRLSGDELDEWGFDRDNGQGTAERAIAQLRKTGDANSPAISSTHHKNTLASARNTKARLHEETRVEGGGESVASVRLGLADVAEPLNDAVDRAIKGRS